MVNLKLLKRMGELCSFKTTEDINEFLDILSEIAKSDDPDYLPFLFAFLQDNPEYIDVRDSLMIVIESYNDNDFVTYLLTELEYYYSKIPDCLVMFFWTVFNTPSCLRILKEKLRLANKGTLLKLLNDIEKDKCSLSEHKVIINELREKLREKT